MSLGVLFARKRDQNVKSRGWGLKCRRNLSDFQSINIVGIAGDLGDAVGNLYKMLEELQEMLCGKLRGMV